ncbi:MAG: hypothetical protein Fur0016_29830 [Anaerolineales bacterium]
MDARKPWVELNQTETAWQAVFACQVCVQPFAELQKLRWGFNAAALLVEALDRQKLFIESQFHGNPFKAPASEEHAIALRCTQIPGEGLLLALLGRAQAASQQEAREHALDYCNELTSTFPYDYKIYPATTPETFEKLIGRQVLAHCQSAQSMAQILRFETQIRTQKGLVYVNGFWQTSDRSDEQTWRTLGNYPRPAMLNISLQPTIIEGDERQFIWDMKTVSFPLENISQMHPAQPFDKWVEPFIDRRLSPWKRYYLLQVHLLSPAGVTDSLARPIGAALTRETADLLSPGFLTVSPANTHEASEWRARLERLEIAPVHFNPTSLSRLSDLADLNEAHSVFRFPYPPEAGLPGVSFIGLIEQ